MPASNVPWAPILTRFPTLFPPQVGVPGTGHTRGLRLGPNGVVLWVDPNHVDANDARDGTEPDAPLRTVAAALTKCRAYMNDTIVVCPNAYWIYGDLTAGRATPMREEVTVTVPGVRIVGLMPSGQLGVPWCVAQNGGVAITVHAMDVLIEGFCFWEDTYTTPVAIRTEWDAPPDYGENLTVRHCFFYDLDYGIQLDYSYNCRIEDNVFQAINTTAIYNMSVEGEPDYLVVRRNDFTACTEAMDLSGTDSVIIEHNVMTDCPTGITITDADRAIIQHNKINITTTTGVAAIPGANATECVIHGNVINGDPAGTNNMINLTSGSDNMVSDNWLSCSIAQYDVTCSDATSGSWVRNHCVNGDTAANPI